MYITTSKPYAASEKGGRANNEDFIYPIPESIDENQQLFIVCDGVGGAQKGEIASAMACELIQTYLASFATGEIDAEIINKAVQYTQVHFNEYIKDNPSAAGMATTLAMVYLGARGVTVAHIGDSRVYQFRKGKIMFQTEDHSLVNSLYRLNAIKKEEMRTHAQRNVILKAIQGGSNPVEADVTLLTDIEDGDIFFICSDGLLEQFNDEELASLFDGSLSSENCKDVLIEKCNGKTKDNYSFYIIPINHVRDSRTMTQNILSFFYSLI